MLLYAVVFRDASLLRSATCRCPRRERDLGQVRHGPFFDVCSRPPVESLWRTCGTCVWNMCGMSWRRCMPCSPRARASGEPVLRSMRRMRGRVLGFVFSGPDSFHLVQLSTPRRSRQAEGKLRSSCTAECAATYHAEHIVRLPLEFCDNSFFDFLDFVLEALLLLSKLGQGGAGVLRAGCFLPLRSAAGALGRCRGRATLQVQGPLQTPQTHQTVLLFSAFLLFFEKSW